MNTLDETFAEIPTSSTKNITSTTQNDQLHSSSQLENERESRATLEVVGNIETRTTEKYDDECEVTSILELSEEPGLTYDNDADVSEAETVQNDRELVEVPDKHLTKNVEQQIALIIFTCNDCGRQFNRSGNLHRHQRLIHFKVGLTRTKRSLHSSSTAIKSDILCKFCHQSFSTVEDRKLHEVEHDKEEKPYRFVNEIILIKIILNSHIFI